MDDLELASSAATCTAPCTAAATTATSSSSPSSSVTQLFMHKPMSAADLSEALEWDAGETNATNVAFDNVIHRDMAEAPPAARTTAERIAEALDGATLPFVAVVIVGTGGNKGLPDKAALLAALGLKNQVDHEFFDEDVDLFEEADLTSRNYAQHTAGFCYEPDDVVVIDNDDEDWRKIKNTTAIMTTELSDHFELNFSDEIVAAPVLFGGRASDGHVVAVLGTRGLL